MALSLKIQIIGGGTIDLPLSEPFDFSKFCSMARDLNYIYFPPSLYVTYMAIASMVLIDSNGQIPTPASEVRQ